MTFPSAQQLARTIGTDVSEFHTVIKPQILKDFGAELRKLGATNPNIGVTNEGYIAFQDVKSGKTYITDVLMEFYLP